jgi:hypothetical protein
LLDTAIHHQPHAQAQQQHGEYHNNNKMFGLHMLQDNSGLDNCRHGMEQTWEKLLHVATISHVCIDKAGIKPQHKGIATQLSPNHASQWPQPCGSAMRPQLFPSSAASMVSVPPALSQPTPALPRHQLPDEASWILTKPVCRTPSPSPFPLLLSTILRLRFMRSPTCRQWLCKAWSPLLGLPLPSWQLLDEQWAEHCATGEMTTRTSTAPCFGPATGRWRSRSQNRGSARTSSTRCGSAHKVATAGVPTRSPLRVCPRDRGHSHKMRNHSSNAQRRTRATCERPVVFCIYIYFLTLVSN